MLNGQKPLHDIRVIAVETQVAAPFCTMMLADAGAEVIKIESRYGDPAREGGPFVKNENGDKFSGYFMRFNRNKKSVTLDIKSKKGRDIFLALVKHADVLVENLRPGTFAKMGLDYEALNKINPSLIYATISGFGQMEGLKGPYSENPAYDIVIQAMGGLMNLIGEENGPPLHPMIAFGDVVPGMLTAYAISLALYKRNISGLGEYIDVAMYDVMLSLTERANTFYSLTKNVLARGKEALVYPWGAFKTKDGYVALIIFEAKMWERFCNVIEKPGLVEDPRFDHAMKRTKNKSELAPIIESWMIKYTSDEVCDILLKAGVPIGKVRTSKDIYECPQADARGMWIEVDDPVGGKVKLVGNPIKMKNVPLDRTAQPAPRLGEHTQEVLSNILNIDEATMEALKTSNVV